MAMLPRSAASLIPDHDDSGTYVNQISPTSKDSGPPPQKKLKVEEDNSSVPISQDSGTKPKFHVFFLICFVVYSDLNHFELN
jgi:hypothetical protein